MWKSCFRPAKIRKAIVELLILVVFVLSLISNAYLLPRSFFGPYMGNSNSRECTWYLYPFIVESCRPSRGFSPFVIVEPLQMSGEPRALRGSGAEDNTATQPFHLSTPRDGGAPADAQLALLGPH